MDIKRYWIVLLLLVLVSVPELLRAEGLDLGAPGLAATPPPEVLGQPSQLVTTVGTGCGPGRDICFAPLIGVDHRKREEVDVLKVMTIHDVNARAGWRLSLFDTVEMSTAAKLPVLSAEQNQSVMSGDQRAGTSTRLLTVDPGRTVGSGVTVGSDMRLKLSDSFNFSLFYDYSKGQSGQQGQQGQQGTDERFGTRLEYRFK